MQSDLPQTLTIDTHSSPVRVSYGVSVVSTNSNLCSAYVTSVLYAIYRKISNIRRAKFQNLSGFRPVLQLSLPNLLKPCVKSRMKM